MDKLFLDTSYVIALSVPKDQNHKKAIQIADFLKIDKAKLITTRAITLEIRCLPKNIGKLQLNCWNRWMKTRMLRLFQSRKIFIDGACSFSRIDQIKNGVLLIVSHL